jgi:outer membrane lipoprotein-sorting protein
MKKHFNERGIAHILIIVIIVVLAVAGGAGYYVYNKQKDKNATSPEVTAAIAAACKTVDKDVCKFMTNWKENDYYTISATSTSGGVASTMTMQIQGDNSHMTSTGGTPYEVISIGNSTYTKDFSDNSWWKYTSTTPTPTETTSSTDLTFTESSETIPEAQRTVYRKIATEACGALNCLKYQVLDPSDTTTTNYIWFDNHDYQLRRMRTTSAEGTYDMVVSYEKFTLTVPTPTKEMDSSMYLGSDTTDYSIPQ